ncbi:MAG TPA: ParB/RepB/Spo0J family partition protein [Nitrospiraceae bacterium]|nr:ParB/RepB/Spo0J family partition protein [Nitrospiraceae bacterium]
MEKKALGKGLEALLPTVHFKEPIPQHSDVQEVPLSQIIPNRYQPRTTFSEREISELSESIKKNGLIQPIMVRRKGDGFYELIAGERRFRATRLAGYTTIKAVIRNSSDGQAMELALVENLQRQDLNPMEAARAYHRLISEFGLTQEEVAQRIGKDRSSIANISRLINLPSDIQQLVELGQLTTGHAKVILGLPTPLAQQSLARSIIDGQLSVRQAEKIASQDTKPKRALKRATLHSDIEERLQKHFGTRIAIQKGRRGGKIMLHYFGFEELDRLIEMLLAVPKG